MHTQKNESRYSNTFRWMLLLRFFSLKCDFQGNLSIFFDGVCCMQLAEIQTNGFYHLVGISDLSSFSHTSNSKYSYSVTIRFSASIHSKCSFFSLVIAWQRNLYTGIIDYTKEKVKNKICSWKIECYPGMGAVHLIYTCGFFFRFANSKMLAEVSNEDVYLP